VLSNVFNGRVRAKLLLSLVFMSVFVRARGDVDQFVFRCECHEQPSILMIFVTFYFLPLCIHGKSLAQYLHVYCVPWTASSIIVRPLNKLNLISSATYLRVAFRRRVQASWISSKLHQHRKLDLPNSQIKSLRRHCGEPDSYSHKSSHKANLNWSYY